MNISSFKRPRPATFVMEWEDEELTVTYDRNRMTPDWFDSIIQTPLRDLLAQIITSWDMLGDDGTPYIPNSALLDVQRVELMRLDVGGDEIIEPTDAEVQAAAWAQLMRLFPQQFLDHVLAQLLDDYTGGKAPSVDSAAGSAPAATRGTSRGSTGKSARRERARA